MPQGVQLKPRECQLCQCNKFSLGDRTLSWVSTSSSTNNLIWEIKQVMWLQLPFL